MKEAILWVEDYEKIEQGRLLIRCKDCKHFVEDVWAVINGLPVIVCHEACYRWSKDGNKVGAEGFCCLAERREE